MENTQKPKSFGRGKKFHQYYPQYQNKFNITEEIAKALGTAHRLDSLNGDNVSLQESPRNEDIQAKFDNLDIISSGSVPLEYKDEAKQLEDKANIDNYGFEEDDNEHASYNTVLASPENSFETAEENDLNGERSDKRNVDEQNKKEAHDVVTLRAIPVKAASKNLTKNSKNSQVESFKAKLVTK